MKQLSSILLIDDDRVTNYLHRILLEELAVAKQISLFTNAEKALDFLKELCIGNSSPELVFLDLNMPGMDGFSFLQTYKEELLHEQCQTIIVVLSSSMNPRDIARVKQIGIAQYFQKPLQKEHITELLSSIK